MDTREGIGTILLVMATVVVAGSILTEGATARALNGTGGLMWLAGAGFVVLGALRESRSWAVWSVASALTVLVAFIVTPSDFVPAVVGFGLAGAVLALVAGSRELLLSKVVVGLYLPLHIGTAVVKAAWRNLAGTETSIRTDPPPTAALVPLAMLVAAVAGGWLVGQWRQRRSDSGLTSARRSRAG